MDQYIALSKKDVKIQITLNEIYSTHSLLAKHLDQMVLHLNISKLILDQRDRRTSSNFTERPWQCPTSTPPQRKYHHRPPAVQPFRNPHRRINLLPRSHPRRHPVHRHKSPLRPTPPRSPLLHPHRPPTGPPKGR